MATKPKTTRKSRYARYTYITRGIGVTVDINFEKGTISLRKKTWVFADREVEYMTGWCDILDAMKVAITEAEKELREFQDAERDEKMELIAEATDIFRSTK